MIETRKIARVLKSKPTIEGAGVNLKRAFGYSQIPMFDPFLLFFENYFILIIDRSHEVYKPWDKYNAWRGDLTILSVCWSGG